MKNFVKNIIYAMVVLFIAVSCSMPDINTTEYDWAAVRDRNAPENNNGANIVPQPWAWIALPTDDHPEVTITFPQEADILRVAHGNIEAALQRFLSFHTYTNPIDPDWQALGMTSILSEAIPFSFTNRNGTSITVTIEEHFIGTFSELVARFDGTAYTHSNGIRMDMDGNGVGGEAIYDDIYITMWGGLPGATTPVGGWVAPGNMGWTISLNAAPSSGSFIWTPGALVSDELASFNAAFLGFWPLPAPTSQTDPSFSVFSDIANLVANDIRLERYSGSNTWVEVTRAVFDPDVSLTTIVFANFTVTHLGVYRIRWTGQPNLMTTETLFGVRQRIFVSGTFPWWTSTMAHFAWTDVRSNNSFITNNNPPGEMFENILASPAVSIHSMDQVGRNVVLRAEFPILGTGIGTDLFVGLEELTLEEFRASFRIATPLWGANFLTASNLLYVNVVDIRYAAEGNKPDATSNADLKNVIYITLDPRYAPGMFGNSLTFLINNNFRYTGSEPVREFGDRLNFLFDNFRQYDVWW
ncbi:MAG: hypothetical protein FWC97_08500 [Treponema sp.]|nr:hypothetical protein [Treponema sp.]